MSGLCKKECSKCGMYDRCGGCSMCDIGFCNCDKNKNKCMVMCPNKFGTFHLVNKSVDNKILLENDKFDIESYIPIMPDRVQSEFNFNKVNKVIAVHGEFLLSSNGDKVSKNYSRGIEAALGIENIKPILEFYVKDRTLEGFWDNRKEIYIQLKELNLYGAIVPNFSLYEDAPRIEHLWNIQRAKKVYNEMIEAGIKAILDVSWATVTDLYYWIEEINKSKIKTIAFSFMNVDTRLKASNAWRHYLLGFEILNLKIDSDIEIIVAGISSVQRAEEILKVASKCNRKISFMHQAAWVNSRKGFLVEQKKQIGKEVATKDEIFQKNMDCYIGEYKKLVEQYK